MIDKHKMQPYLVVFLRYTRDMHVFLVIPALQAQDWSLLKTQGAKTYHVGILIAVIEF